MKLHLVRGDLDFHWLQPLGGVRWTCRGGTPVTRPWRVPQLVLPEGNDENDFLPVDCLSMNTGCDGPVISEFARSALGMMLEPAGELLPVDVLGRRYWWLNCLAEVHALDPDSTDADWGSVEADGEEFRWILAPRRLAFQPGKIAMAPAVFRVPEFPHGALFADQRLKRAVAQHQLTGFRMDLVWSLDTGGVANPAGFDFSDVWTRPRNGTLQRKLAFARATLEGRIARPE